MKLPINKMNNAEYYFIQPVDNFLKYAFLLAN